MKPFENNGYSQRYFADTSEPETNRSNADILSESQGTLETPDRRLSSNNRAEVSGTICDEIKISHRAYGELFYASSLLIPRYSGTVDRVPFIISEYLLTEPLTEGDCVHIVGQFRSHNNKNDSAKKLSLYVFAKEIEKLDPDSNPNLNSVYLNGYLCKPPSCRKTPLGRDIADILIAVNRRFNKSNYIPCIAWGRLAILARTLDTGSNIELCGRIQSRDYTKRVPVQNDDADDLGDESEASDYIYETRTAYEISISKLTVISRPEKSDNDEEYDVDSDNAERFLDSGLDCFD